MDAKASALGLQCVDLLRGVDVDVVHRLAQSCGWRRVRAGSSITSRAASDCEVYLIVAGRIRVTAYAAGGRQVIYREAGDGDWFGEVCAIDGAASCADVDALEDSVLAVLTRSTFRELVDRQPIVRERVMARLASLVRDLTDRVFDLATLAVHTRVQTELLRLARTAGIEANQARIEPAPRHSDLAGKVGTYREQVTRELTIMEKMGLLHRSHRAWHIPDVTRLEGLVACRHAAPQPAPRLGTAAIAPRPASLHVAGMNARGAIH